MSIMKLRIRILSKSFHSGYSLAKLFFLIWLVTLIGFILTTIIANSKVDSRGQYPSEISTAFSIELIVGITTFFLGCIFIFLGSMDKSKKIHIRIALGLLTIFFLPFYFLKTVFKSKDSNKQVTLDLHEQKVKKAINIRLIFDKLTSLVLFVTTAPLWVLGYLGLAFILNFFLGVVTYPVPIVGNSMNPTILNGEKVNAYPYSSLMINIRKVSRGDIVVAHNEKTTDEKGQNIDYLKRIVGLPRDKIEIRDGYLFVNNNMKDEPYIAKARSTFGRDFIQDCKIIEIPENQVFVLGDNRKRSKDSRDVGFMPISGIKYILPFNKQDKYKNRWRDTSNDKTQVGLASFDVLSYYDKLNKIREEKGLKPLKRNEKLEEAAKKRATTIIDYNELKTDPARSHLAPEEVLQNVGYYNIITGEIHTTGYYDAEELANYWLEFNTKEYILHKDYQETGVAAVDGKINGCETQIIVQEFGGYIPPSYSRSDIEGWKNSLTQLRNILPSWENIRNFPETYSKTKTKADRIIEIFKLRISYIERIVSKMESNQWFSEEERSYTIKDRSLYEEQESIAKELNTDRWK